MSKVPFAKASEKLPMFAVEPRRTGAAAALLRAGSVGAKTSVSCRGVK